ncbi:MAG: DUF268 domain-containing protein [Lachnospiraceae bacterium]|nr:DUF268 domain-containing protein [Lachnospiraceae bacterium]
MSKLLIWGTGNLAKRFIDNQYNGEIIGFIETNKSVDTYMDKPVFDSRELPKEYDYIIVANSYTAEVYDWCLKLKIDISKLIFLHGVKQQMGCKDEAVIQSILSEKNYTIYCAEFNLIENSFIQSDIEAYIQLNKRHNFAIQKQNMWPIIRDKYAPAGTIGNYFWQDLWAARIIIAQGIREHFDIGSRLDGFIAHLLAANIDVTMIDVRPFPAKVAHLHTIVDNATNLHQIEDESIDSMSALCSIEHFGLGRYGDPIDPDSCFKCFDSIQKKLRKGGQLYISLPIGRERVEFNAHRVFYAQTVLECFSELHLIEFSCTTEAGIEHNVDIHAYDNDGHNGEYRYGLFHFMK